MRSRRGHTPTVASFDPAVLAYVGAGFSRTLLLGADDLHVVQRAEIDVENLRSNLIAGLYLVVNVRLLGRVRHRHRAHPAFEVLTVHRERLGFGIDLLSVA